MVDAKLNDLNEPCHDSKVDRRWHLRREYPSDRQRRDAVGTDPLNDVATNFIPVKLCDWQAVCGPWGTGKRLVAVDANGSTVLEWGGTPGQEDFIADVLVKDNILTLWGIAWRADSTGAIWGVSLGQPVFEIIAPNDGVWTASQMTPLICEATASGCCVSIGSTMVTERHKRPTTSSTRCGGPKLGYWSGGLVK